MTISNIGIRATSKPLGLTAVSAAAILAAGEAEAQTITMATVLNQNDVSVQAMEEWNRLLQERTEGEMELNRRRYAWRYQGTDPATLLRRNRY